MSLSHEQLWQIVVTLPRDYEPWGLIDRECGDDFLPDCSTGCRWYVPLEDPRGADWGVCASPTSHRSGLLTFEHQGCERFEYGDEEDDG